MKPILIIAASTDATMRYASGVFISDAFILLDTGKKKHLLVSTLEYGFVKKKLAGTTGVLVDLWDKYYEKITKKKGTKSPKKGASGLALLATAFLKEKKIKRVVMPRNTWASVLETLRTESIRVEISRTTLYPERVVKNEEEIAAIKETSAAAVRAMERCIAILKASRVMADKTLRWQDKRVTSELLRLEARKVLLESEVEGPELIISHGAQCATPHDEGSGAIKVGEPVVLDFFPKSMKSGYWSDMTRTVCKGTPSPELRALWNAVNDAQGAALRTIKAGAYARDIHAAAVATFKERGYKTTNEEGFIHSAGHGVGLEIHEAPSLSPKSNERLRKGMVIAVEPGLYYKEIGGVRIEDTVLVTKKGFINLTPTAKTLRL